MSRHVQPRFYNQTPPKASPPEGGRQREHNFLSTSVGGGSPHNSAWVLTSPEWISQGSPGAHAVCRSNFLWAHSGSLGRAVLHTLVRAKGALLANGCPARPSKPMTLRGPRPP
eukprot:6598316-Pyramimonas_sp.AAC.1